MSTAIEFVLNGRGVRLEGISPNTTLLEYLRGAGLTGAKEGCAEGDCGACSVVIVDRDAAGQPSYRAINSCLVPVCLLAGRELVSVEGVAGEHEGGLPTNKILHPVQQKMVQHHGSQCGYCTPGFIMSLFEGYYRGDIREADQLDDQLCGNLCRCTGYRPIRDAACDAFPERHRKNGSDPFAERLRKAPATVGAAEYSTGPEKFFRPDTLAGVFRLLQQFPDARLIAGATELGLEITKRFKKFSTLISLEAVPELTQIECTETEWRIGAAVTLTRIEEQLAEEFPALGDMLRVFGSRQIRNRATMGGNLVTASPIGDSAPVLLALDARVVLASAATGGQRTQRVLPLDDFFLAYRKTALQPGEILQTILIPRGQPQPNLSRKCHWYKVSKRREMDISTVAACFAVDTDAAGIIRHARLAYGGVAPTPLRARKTEQALAGQPWSEETIAQIVPVLATEFSPISDLRGSAEYRRALITSLLRKFYSESEENSVAQTRPLTSTPLHARAMPRPALPAPPHESAHKHVTGEALYTDDQTSAMLEVWPVCSPHARARILQIDASAARSMPGVHAVLLAGDIGGENNVGPVKHDEPLLAESEVLFHGQIVALVVGDSQAACRAAADKVVVHYDPLPPILTLEQALAARSFHNEPNYIRRGKVGDALKKSPVTLRGVFELQGQEHFYLETQAAWAEPGEDGALFVSSSTQHPSEVQAVVAHALKLPINQVVVQSLRMGGGFGGKETQAAAVAALAALAAKTTGRPVRVRWNRDQDMALCGHRHPFLARFHVGFDKQGRLRAARVHLYSNGGWAMDLSQAITDRALFHLDNAYYIPAVEFRGQVAKTNLASNTAFRGFGGPQGMVVMEEILDRVARRLKLAPELVRERNLYHGKGRTNTTHYGQELGDNRIQTIWHGLKSGSEFARRREAIAQWNREHPHRKRGLAMTPVKFGISFTVSHLNQAGALLLAYPDGTVQINHGGTEMGQGLHTNIRILTAQALGIPLQDVRVMPTTTDKVPNTSATAASSGTDLNGAAVQDACVKLRARLAPVAARLLKLKPGKASDRLVFANGTVSRADKPGSAVRFADVVRQAYLDRISLSVTGYYATPGVAWDRDAGRGRPFYYFAYGAAVSEVEVDGFTGMTRVRRVDILHDVGDSINEAINRGQIEGGFVQGVGWLTCEELLWDEQGRLLTHSPDTYKIPAVGDTPEVFNITLLPNAAQTGVVHGSKAVGEPPFMLALSVREAIRDAVAAFGAAGRPVPLPLPATCEAIFMAVQRVCAESTRRSQRAALVA